MSHNKWWLQVGNKVSVEHQPVDIPPQRLTARPWKDTESQEERIVFQSQFFRGELLNF